MRYIVDTNVLSEMRKGKRGDPGVQRWANEADYKDLAISVVTLFELERGERSVRRRDPAQAAVFRRWIDEIVRTKFIGRILPVDDTVAVRCAALHVPDRRPLPDSLIAATALVHGLTVVSRNEADFRPMGVDIVNPWLATSS